MQFEWNRNGKGTVVKQNRKRKIAEGEMEQEGERSCCENGTERGKVLW